MKLSDIQTKAKLKPPRLVVHGPAGIGKTTFAASLPNPIFVQTEDGLGQIDVPHFPLAKSFDQVTGALDALLTEDHDYKSVVVDSLDWLEAHVWRAVCEHHGKNSIEEFGYGKGYVEALVFWRRYIDMLNRLRDEKGMVICQIAHSQQRNVSPPDSEPFERYEIKLHKKASELVQEHSDIVGFCNVKTTLKKSEGQGGRNFTKATSTGKRYLYTSVQPAYIAKNRYGITEELPLDWAELRAAMLPKQVKSEEAKEAAE